MSDVTQADREAADNAVLAAAKDIENGNTGGTEWLADLFAAHRIAAEKAGDVALATAYQCGYDAAEERAEKAVMGRFDEDWLADIIQDSFEMDWTARDGARAIVRSIGLKT